jgi:hypothetical protein
VILEVSLLSSLDILFRFKDVQCIGRVVGRDRPLQEGHSREESEEIMRSCSCYLDPFVKFIVDDRDVADTVSVMNVLVR